MKLTELEFQRYHGYSHPKTDERLIAEVTYYAIPGGGIATAPQCELWGLHYGVKVSFQ